MISRHSKRLFRQALCGAVLLGGCASDPSFSRWGTTTQRVEQTAAHRYYTPVNQTLTPAGRLIELPGMRPQALALSPNGRILVTSGKTAALLVLEPGSGRMLQKVTLPSEDAEPGEEAVSTHELKPDTSGQLSFTGLVFSPDGTRLYLSNVKGSVKVFAVSPEGRVQPLHSLWLPEIKIGKRREDIPAGLAISPDGQRLYVALNLSNRLLELDTQNGQAWRVWDVGFAPYDVALCGDKLYVSNWGGRRPETNSLTGPAGQTTRVRVDPVRHIANEGSVSVINLAANRVEREILTGSHASALAVSPNRRHLVVANTDSDTLSVLDTRTDEIVETVCSRMNPADLFGASPNALAFDASGRRLYVCNATQNAVAVLAFVPGQTRLLGLIPVGWFPGAVVPDPARHSLYVANLKGVGNNRRLSTVATNGVTPHDFNSHQYRGSLSLVPLPKDRELAESTRAVQFNLRYPLLEAARQPARPGRAPCPVPERPGEPSVFQHVVYIIKENRTYDQVLGDLPQGNGKAALCIFGESISPNHHALARQFVLLDNLYCSGVLSADGHQWADSAFANDYMERAFAGFPRSYPDGMEDTDVDALAYSPAGFIWDLALAHGRTLRDYGEFAITDKKWADPARKGKIQWLDHYRDFCQGAPAIRLGSHPAIESLRGSLCTNTVGWDLDVPDVWRAAQFIRELRQFEQAGQFPHLTLICLPNDHTSGTKFGAPTPAAQMADNDLALGQIIESLSRSRFWKDTCIFVIEDDPQNGWDHVSGFRTVGFVASPYTRRRQVIPTQYNQTSVLRTMELILGLPPMNQMDATATPMFDCFSATPDFTPYRALTNNVPLDQMNPQPKAVLDPLLRRQAYASARLPLQQADRCPEALLNRILWHALKGSQAPYPAWAERLLEED